MMPAGTPVVLLSSTGERGWRPRPVQALSGAGARVWSTTGARVWSTSGELHLHRAEDGKVDLGLLQDDMPTPGEWVLIHVGFAMSKISEEDAIDQMRTLRALGEAESAMQEVQGYGLENVDGKRAS